MQVKRFIARNSRDALKLVREELGEDAVVMSTQPCPQGIELIAMAADAAKAWQEQWADAPTVSCVSTEGGDSIRQHEAHPDHELNSATQPARFDQFSHSSLDQDEAQADDEAPRGEDDMSTLSFQDYVRQRMLKRRRNEQDQQSDESVTDDEVAAPATVSNFSAAAAELAQALAVSERQNLKTAPQVPAQAAAPSKRTPADRPAPAPRATEMRTETPAARVDLSIPAISPALRPQPALSSPSASNQRQMQVMMNELGQMRQLIEDRFNALTFMEKLHCKPHQGEFSQRMMERGFSTGLVRALVQAMPEGVSADGVDRWASAQLVQHLRSDWGDTALEDQGGIFALIGTTGVGKTTTTAKLAAAFAMRHGTANLGLITLDAYRIGAQEQLRAYGRILGVPVHTAHDRSSLEDLLNLLAGKKMILIDTAGMAQRDHRTRELLDMVTRNDIAHLLVLNAAAQGDTLEDITVAYQGQRCAGVILSKVDETLKLGPALDIVLRHQLKVVGVANGQRVPEDWHRLSPQALVQRAMAAVAASAFRFEAKDSSMAFLSQSNAVSNPAVLH